MQFGQERLSLGRLERAVDAARDCGFAAVSANDHFVFQTAWLDGPTALASMLASAYNTTPERFSAARTGLARALEDRGRDADGFPNALATMWTWVSNDRAEGDRVLAEVLAPLLNRDPEELRGQVCIGPAEHCAELLSRYAQAGCQRVYLWPLGEEQRQLELVASEVAPMVGGTEAAAV
jgi:hypothetical protein